MQGDPNGSVLSSALDFHGFRGWRAPIFPVEEVSVSGFRLVLLLQLEDVPERGNFGGKITPQTAD